MRGEGNVPVRASLHGDGGVIADVVLTAKRSVRDVTLTIEFEGPRTLWLDRLYLIDTDAVLGLWRPDVVTALKAMNPGIVRFGGSTVEEFEWSDTIGGWDTRLRSPTIREGGCRRISSA